MADNSRQHLTWLLDKHGYDIRKDKPHRAEGGAVPDVEFSSLASPEGYALAKLEAERQGIERYNKDARVPYPPKLDGTDRADFLRSEHDTRPSDEYRERGMLLPWARSPYTGESSVSWPSPVKAVLDQIRETQRMRGDLAKSFKETPDKPFDVYQGPVNRVAGELIDSPKQAATFAYRGATGDVPLFDYDMESGRLVPSQRAIGESTNLAGNLMIGGGMVTKPEGSAGIFAGRTAKTADQAALARAEDMASNGVPREQIWKDTGWFKGVDGKWRFEIDDSASSAKFGRGHMDQQITHPKLYEAYPDMVDARAVIDKSRFNEGAAYGNDAISVGASNLDKARNTALHEIQHLVQGKEGTSVGGDPFSNVRMHKVPFTDLLMADPFEYFGAYKKYKRLAGETEARAVEKRADLTPEQRANRAPWLDYDIPEKDQIVRHGIALANSSKQAGTAALAMDEASRMARARELGFDTNQKWYHGTTGYEPIMRDGFNKKWPHFSSDKSIADSYQGWDRGGIPGTVEAYLRYKNPAFYDAKGSKYTDIANKVFGATWDAERAGHDAMVIRNIRDHMDSSVPAKPHDTVVVFDPKNVRSTDAAFDPAQTHSPNLLASNASDKAGIPGIALANERKGITAYHGSPYAFDRFDPGKIGSGEGAQAYGYGHYFAGNEKVANEYRKALTGNHAGDIHIPTVDGVEVANPSQTLRNIIRDGGNAASFLERMKPRLAEAEAALQKSRLGGDELETMLAETDYSRVKGIIDEASGLVGRRVGTKPAGHTYEVKINADPDHFLDWDKPLTQQPHVMAKMDSELPSYAHDNSPETVKMLRDNLGYSHVDTGKDVYQMGGRDVEGNQRYEDFARILRDKGIPGIRYLDQGSRSAGEGTRNYVVFPGNENIVEILRRYANASMPAGIPGITLDRSSDRRRGAH